MREGRAAWRVSSGLRKTNSPGCRITGEFVFLSLSAVFTQDEANGSHI
jgi:hypothetical protein